MRRRIAIVLLSGVLTSCGVPVVAPTATPVMPVKVGEAPFRDVLFRPHQRTILGGAARISFGPDEAAADGQWRLQYQHGGDGAGRRIEREERKLVYLLGTNHEGAMVSFGVVLTPAIDRVQLELTTGEIVPVEVQDGLFYLRHPLGVDVRRMTLIHENGETKTVDDF